MDKEIEKLNIASKLADAMIKEIKEKNLVKDILNLGCNFESFTKLVISAFWFKLGKLTFEFIDNNKEEIGDDEKGELEVLKNMFGW